MKALLVTLGVYSSVGGIERFNQRVVACLSELGISDGLESWVIALWDSAAGQAAAPWPVHFLPGGSNKFRTAAAFLGQVWRIQPDVIFYDHVLLAPLAVPARAICRKSRQMLLVYGAEVWNDPSFRKAPLAEIAAVRCCVDVVVSISRYTATKMAKAFGLPEASFRLLPCAVDLGNEHGQGIAERTNGQRRTLLTVARMGPKDLYKGIDKVILSLPQILSVVPQARYVVVGDGALRPELMALAERTGVSNRVDFLGRIDDKQLEEAYAASDVFVMPSKGEGFGIVFLEAWKYRLPVICGNQDASAEVVTNGVDGLCVDPDSVTDIAAAILTLLKDREKARAMGQLGRQTVLERYTHDRFRNRLREILNT